MKKLYLLFSFLILFQSCFSYKTVNVNSITIDKKQKVEVKEIGGTNIKGTLVFKNEEILTLDNNGQLLKIPMSEIYKVKVRKFSFFKTGISLISSLPVIYGLVAVVALSAGDLN